MKGDDLEKIETELFLEALYRRYGFDFRSYARSSIHRRLRLLLAQTPYQTTSDMISKILHDENFAKQAINLFSITVTEMFRDPDFYKVLRQKAVPYLRTFPFIRIWVAGCATGEEVYSLAILLREENLYERAQIYATDYNEHVLQQAKEGVYPLKAMQQYKKNYQKSGGLYALSDYYQTQDDNAIMASMLKEHITFASHNLVTDGVFGVMHLILCRNVLIYFDSTLQNRVLNLLLESLIYKGFLCIGTKESLMFTDIVSHFKIVDEQFRIYQKSDTHPETV